MAVYSRPFSVGSHSRQWAVGLLLFVISDLLFHIEVQSKKYKIQICNALSLRVILERLSARGLYREVYLARVFFTKKTSRYYWIPATAGFQSLEVTLHISKVLNESKTPSVQNRREGRALRKGLVDLFSEWARWRVGFGMKYFTSSKNHSLKILSKDAELTRRFSR